LKKNSF